MLSLTKSSRSCAQSWILTMPGSSGKVSSYFLQAWLTTVLAVLSTATAVIHSSLHDSLSLP